MAHFAKGQVITAEVMDRNESCLHCFSERAQTVPKQTVHPLPCGLRALCLLACRRQLTEICT